jgi:UPF0755 protein
LLGALVVVLGLVGGGASWLWLDLQRSLTKPLVLDGPVLFTIAPGAGLAQIAKQLAAKGWLEQTSYLRLEALRDKRLARLQAGVYEVTPGITLRGLLTRFALGDVKRYRYTLVEGSTFHQYLQLLEGLDGVAHTMKGQAPEAWMSALGEPATPAEGAFFPSTYFYTHGTRDLALAKQARAQMQKVLAAAWKKRAPGLPYARVEEALTMASIIEKETGAAAERAEVAGVFVRRLAMGMRLQTDPTVIYGLGAAFDGNLRRNDLKRDTPFNTYTRAGLPPTPIAMPGAAAIAAALAPAPGKALYFVAKGDGTHVFSSNLAAHQRAVRRFQKR